MTIDGFDVARALQDWVNSQVEVPGSVFCMARTEGLRARPADGAPMKGEFLVHVSFVVEPFVIRVEPVHTSQRE